MSDAPETIWAGFRGAEMSTSATNRDTQYTRTDTIDAIKAQVWQEAIEAASERVDGKLSKKGDYRNAQACRDIIRAIPNPHEVNK